MTRIPSHRLYLRLLAVLAALFSLPAAAADEHEKPGQTFTAGDLDITVTLDAGLGYFSIVNAQNGQGSTGRNGTRQGGRAWSEGFIAPGLALDWQLQDSSLYAITRLVGSLTRGDGDAQSNSSTSDRPEALGLDTAAIGWKSGIALPHLGEDAIDVSLGRQGFVIGDGFLLADGTADGFKRGAYVLGPRGSFDRTAIAKLNTEPVRAELFHLEGNVDQSFMRGNDAAATKLYGGNLEWFASSHQDHGRFEYDERQWYLGLTVLHVYDADRGVAARREGLDTYSLRLGGAVLAGLGEAWHDFALYAEAGRQRNKDAGRDSQASAWYVEPQYTFSALPWTPRLSYRHARFSGDNNANDGRNHAWDSLYTGGGPRGFGSWDQGEIYARYVGSNTNLVSQMAHLRLQPAEDLALGLLFYRHSFDKRPAGVRDDHQLDEVNLYGEWETPIKGVSLTGVLGAAKAGDGRRQQLGNTDATDRTTWLGQIVLGYSF